MRNRGVGSWTARRARMSPGRVAVVHNDREWTYARLHERATRLAHALAGMGVGHRDRVAYLGSNHPTFLEALFGAGQLGAVFLPLNWRLAPPELAYILRDAGAGVLLAGPGQGAAAAHLAGLVRVPVLAAGEEYERALAAAGDLELDERVDPDDCCMIMYTSGTTGRPKGVMLSHAAIAWNSFNLLLDVDLTSEEVTLVVAPMFHAAALNQTVLPTVLKGGRVVLVSAFDPGGALELIARHRVTYLFGVPTMFLAMARAPGWADADLSSVRSAICGGAPVPETVIAAYQARGVTFLQGYGLTEAGPGVLFLRRDDSVRKAGSAGTATFFTDVRLMPPDGGPVAPDGPGLPDGPGRPGRPGRPDRPGSPVAPGEPGEILVQGPNVMAGYWNRPEETAAVLPADGWLRTGDIGVADADGYITILDRTRDLIISGGENIYPAEVENALYGHPAVAECAVIGIPDEHWGEVGRALVVPRAGARPDAADLLAFLADRIAKYKIPKSVVFTDALPRSTSGKVLKSELRSRFGAGAGRSTAVPTVANGLAELRALAGADLGTSEWLEITQDRVNAFAGATSDDQWIHVDVERARTGPFGGTVAHGYLTLALVIPLWTEMLRIEGVDMAINYGLNRLRFPEPVPVGSKIRLRARVVAVTDVPDGVQLTAELTVEVQGATKPAAVAEALFRYYGAGTAGHGRRLS